MSLHVHPDIEQLVPYSPGKPLDELERELGISHAIKLASNENPLGPSPKALAVLRMRPRHSIGIRMAARIILFEP